MSRRPPDPPPDLATVAADWITLWQSEAAGIAADREMQEAWQRMAALWAAQMGAMLSTWPGGADAAAGRAGPAPPPGPPTAAAASDDGELARLRQRVAELEHRLAELERGR